MLYVIKETGSIYTERNLYRELNVMRSKPPRDQDLVAWGVAELQSDISTDSDVYSPLKTASIAQDGLWYRDYDTRSFTPEELTNYRSSASQQIKSHYDNIVESLADRYAMFERDSWQYQRLESESYIEWSIGDMLSPAPVTIVIDGIAGDVDHEVKLDFCNKVLQKVEDYKQLVAPYIRLARQARSDIENATSRVEIDAIVQQIQSS